MKVKNAVNCIAFVFLLCSGCTFFDNFSSDPAFLIVENVQLNTLSLQGHPSHKIEDLWVYADGQFLGVFPLPARIPILADGTVKSIRFAAGIRPNAVNTNSVEYPFYAPILQDLKLDSGKSYPLSLTFSYAQTTVFDFIEAFEGVPFFTKQLKGSPEASMTSSTKNIFSGTRSGLIRLGPSDTECEITSEVKFSNKNNKKGAVYLEMDYQTSIEVFIGVILENSTQELKSYKVGLKPNESWNKVYINFTEEISSPFVEEYRIVIGVQKPASVTNSESYFDNIKLLHF